MDKVLSPEAVEKLEEYHWPGNVRELENVIHRLYISERDRIIGGETVEHLLNDTVYEEMIINLRKEVSREDMVDFNQIMEEQERRLISYALKKEGTTRKAAEYLNLPQATLARKKSATVCSGFFLILKMLYPMRISEAWSRSDA